MSCDRQHATGEHGSTTKTIFKIWDDHQQGQGLSADGHQVFGHFGMTVDAILAKEAELEAREVARAAKKT